MRDQDGGGDGEPAHHARRPMNAFLIFCKRHRSVVRDKYPNLENRSITKILGEWWANLDKEEKACYTGLAKQYKDAFFNANPDFKWYKLPAPPLRTLSSRPREPHEKTSESPEPDYQDEEVEKTNNNSTQHDFNKKSHNVYENEQRPLSMFTPGKLADEAQMGGLSSLLATKTEAQTLNPYYAPPPYKFNLISGLEDDKLRIMKPKSYTREESIRELQNALSETTRMFENLDEHRGNVKAIYTHGVPNDQLTNQDVIDQIVDKRFYKEDDFGYDDERNTRSGRSCKGKRYQEFMAVGGLLVNKRQKREHYDKSPEQCDTATCSWDPGSRSEESTITDESKLNSCETSIEGETNNETEIPDPDNNANKTFKAADFDLDAKIRALPSLSLEKFQQKKRDNKRKKKTINLRPKMQESSQIINSVPRPFIPKERREMAETWREHVIGSQKRKPKKISITRLEINSLVSSVDLNAAHKISPEIKIATEAPCTVVQNMDICRQPDHGNIDLLALATLAEVASNTSKMEETSILGHMMTKTSDDNTSKV